MPLVYSKEEKINIIKWYYSSQGGTQEVIGRFVFSFPDRPVPCRRTILDIIHRFEKSGCINGCSKCYQSNFHPISEERIEKEVSVCAFVESSEPCSSRQISEQLGIPKTTVRRILHKKKYKCYKVRKNQEIFPDDQFRRLEFCEAIREKCDNDDNFTRNILFTDESTFSLHKRHNPSAVRYWSQKNKHLSRDVTTQYPQKLNVWAGILGDHIIGPFFLNGTLNAQSYLQLLQNHIVPAVRDLAVNFNDIWFQQDGCPAHNARIVQECLSLHFPHTISTRGNISWPPRSPDLTPCDFFLWGYLNETIYVHQNERPRTLDDLRMRITQLCNSISPVTLSNVRREFYNRLGYCEANNGGLFERDIY